jgi:hypothetical protein
LASAFNKIQSFVAAVHNGSHNLSTASLVIALTNASNAPVATNTQLSNLTTISYTNLSSRSITTTSSSQSSGTYKLVCQDLLLTASGAVATFRYVVLYDDSSTNDLLICWWDYGADVTLANTETFNIDLDQSNGVFSTT